MCVPLQIVSIIIHKMVDIIKGRTARERGGADRVTERREIDKVCANYL